MGRSHCCDNPCQANLTKYAGATGKIQWQKALFGEGFINSSFSAPNSPADVLSVVASTTPGRLWVTLAERRSTGEITRLLHLDSDTGQILQVVQDCHPVTRSVGFAPTIIPERANIAPLNGGGVAVFARSVNTGTAFSLMLVNNSGTVEGGFTPTFTAADAVSVFALATGEIAVLESGGTDRQRLYDAGGTLLWSTTNGGNLVSGQHANGNLLMREQGSFTTVGPVLTVSPADGATVSSKSVSGEVQAGCVAGSGYALARATANEILLCDSTLVTTATISANVTSGGAVLAGDTSRFVAACDRVRYYNTAGTQQWSELVPSNGFTSIALDAAGDVYVGSVRGNVRTEGTTVNGF